MSKTNQMTFVDSSAQQTKNNDKAISDEYAALAEKMSSKPLINDDAIVMSESDQISLF